MSDDTSRRRRRSVLLLGAGLGVVIAGTAAVALVSGLAIADQPGRSLEVPAVVVEVGTGTPSDGPATVPTGAATPTPGASVAPDQPALVPAPTPVIVDDHGGDRPGNGGSSGSSGSSGTSGGSGSSGSGGSSDD